MRRALLWGFVISLLSIAVMAQESGTTQAILERGSLFKIGRSVEIAASERAENVISIGGRVDVLGEVRESVIVVGGSVNVTGRIDEDLVVLGGDVILDAGSYVGGDVAISGGELHRSASAQIGGKIKDDEFWGENWREFSRQGSRYIGVSDGPGFFFGLIATLLFGLLVAYLMPKQIQTQVEAIGREPLKMLGFGFLALLLFVPLVVLLAITILGIPLIPIVVLAYVLAAFMGVVSCSMIVGKFVGHRLLTEPMSALLLLALGIIVLAILRLIPVVGELLTLVLLLVGMGVVLATRFGTHPLVPQPQQQPQP